LPRYRALTPKKTTQRLFVEAKPTDHWSI